VNDKPNELSAFERRARQALDESVEHLDASTRSKLTQARYAAVAAAGTKRRRWQWLVPAGSLATAAAVAVLVIASRAPIQGHETGGSLEDLEIVAQDENMDMLQDVDFYAWIDTDEQAAKDSST
jgi:hypothetical protein